MKKGTRAPLKYSSIRFYLIDLYLLSYFITNNHYTYTKDVAKHLNRSKSSINRHMAKFVKLGLIERHGSIFCSKTSYSIPEYNIPPLLDLLKSLNEEFSFKPPKRDVYVKLEILPAPVPYGHIQLSTMGTIVTICTEHRVYHDPSRPNNNSTPYKKSKQLSIALFSHSPRTLQTRLTSSFQRLLRDYG